MLLKYTIICFVVFQLESSKGCDYSFFTLLVFLGHKTKWTLPLLSDCICIAQGWDFFPTWHSLVQICYSDCETNAHCHVKMAFYWPVF